MHVSFLRYLADPKTKESLELVSTHRKGDIVLEGRLVSAQGSYPIVRGIPRFAGYLAETNYAKSFAYQWNKWSRVQFESENVGGPMSGHTLHMWERITAIEVEDLRGALIGDFGCGPGRFIDIVRRKNGRVIGIDISAAVEAARENFREDAGVLICQADLLHPPIKAESFDGAFSIGVLHHTPDPFRGVEQIVRSVRPGGWVAISVYGKGGYYDFPTVRLWRLVFRALWPVLGHYPPLAYSYLATYVLRPLSRVPVLGLAVPALFPFLRLPDARWSLLDTFDSVTPVYQSAHDSYEVFEWFRRCGLTQIAPSDWGFTAYHGRRG